MSRLAELLERVAIVDDERETQRVAAALAETAPPGAVLILSGGLGAGKTTLIRYLAEALGMDPHIVRSPTFTLIHEYRDGRLPLVHMDVYRLQHPEEFEAIGGHEYVDRSEGIVAIEWGERVLGELDDDWLQLHIDFAPDSEKRTISVRGVGPHGAEWAKRLTERLQSEGKA